MAQQSDPIVTLSSVLILAAIGLFAWTSPPLRTARPPSDDELARRFQYDDEVLARLWQDPLDAVRQRPTKEKAKDPSSPTGGVASGARDRLSLQIAKKLKGAKDQDAKKEGEITVLLAPLTGEFYAEIRETRRRKRYAILSALGFLHFVPESAEKLGLHHVRRLPTAGSPGTDTTVAYEWYEYEDPTTGTRASRWVLVLWLDETWIAEEPFARLLHLVREVHDLQVCGAARVAGNIGWLVVGPSISDTLRAMVDDASKSKATEQLRTETGLRSFHILSPSATVADSDLGGELTDEQLVEASDLLGAQFRSPCTPDTTCMRFVRTIRSDRVLIDEIAEELAERRGVESGDRVIVLSEWDTYFGRSLPRALQKALGDRLGDIEVQQYTYERGIDGIMLGSTEAVASPGTNARSTATGDKAPTASVRPPFGTGQYDYVRRLAREIQEANERLREERGRGIKAVAVLGSDVYDKLLILRALRERVPGAVWITTDLDANLLHPDEFATTRNLVVASTFDLTFPPDVQGASPPFRGSYQASTYLATILGMCRNEASSERCKQVTSRWGPEFYAASGEPFPGQAAVYEALPPILFEIGRHGVVRLDVPAPDRDRDRDTDGDEPRPAAINAGTEASFGPYLLGAGILGGLGLLLLHQVRPRSGRAVLSLGALGLFGGGLACLATTMEGGEPFDLMAGVSVWPTIFIRWVTIGLTLVFVRSTIVRLDQGWDELDRHYFAGEEVMPDRGLTLRDALGGIVGSVRQIQRWGLACALLLGAVVAVMNAFRLVSLPLTNKLLLQSGVFGFLIVLWWTVMYAPRRKIRSVNKWIEQQSTDTGPGLWQRYHRYGSSRDRVLRSAGTGLVYFAFGSLIFTILGAGADPVRGGRAMGFLNGFSIGVAVPLMIFLLFLIVDAIRLCVAWIEKLQQPGLVWPEAVIEQVAAKRRIPEEVTPHWLSVKLIGERTREISGLIYYPLLIILLMLLARSTYFDGFDFPAALAIIVGANFTIVLGAAAALISTARRARERIIERMREAKIEEERKQDPSPPPPSPEQIDLLAKQLSELKVGAYQRFWDQPLVRAAILLATGFALTWTEYGWLLR